MSKEFSRGAALGLLLSAIALSSIYWYAPDLISSGKQTAETEEINSQLYEQEEIEIKLANKEKKIKELEQDLSEVRAESEGAKSETDQVHHAVFEIESGESAEEISDRLAEKNILENSESFYQKLSDKNLQSHIQTGTFHLNSTMNSEEIIEQITS
ncbi:endolytic transglycosylase MltG [Salisediminibacterium halotolerans]|uniref:endolytic transglycosylase MltG n=1 Tax=Salisediminibacterium halotolerans TaxID=517425 RepID=UPI000EAFDC81|nr:endolytic transglycosylase MltG [Salisediminibacterium halotolerans]RLJ78115.1 YceG-like family protein [Actinophytocola xinjiangensis]RPE88546.1 YceG-like family protein [Salisediminibacterium halotolerans]TWG37092.1 YceG-like family protein [Salisediminibacterium halotolerans]GEL09039.1 hypothetical protein SHA02_24550 [Salisediminibacterium halotolerans]